ncbi:MAG: carbohydrate kinase, partial [Clostridia bacterium]|nr:carbohydrate kinase [Clostridia bacterium]
FENSALGTAIVTFTSIGVHPDVNTAVKEMVRYKDKFTPNLENKKVYDDLFYKVYLKMYKKLKKFYIHLEDKF